MFESLHSLGATAYGYCERCNLPILLLGDGFWLDASDTGEDLEAAYCQDGRAHLPAS